MAANDIKKISVSELRLGMYLVGFDGNWLSNPFWTSRFLLASADELRQARASGLAECWIDTSLGADVAPVAPARSTAGAAPVAKRRRAPPQAAGALSMEEELQNAARLCQTARASIFSMFSQARLGKIADTHFCSALVDDIVRSVERHPGALISLSRLKYEDDYTYMHSVAVCALMVALAKAMKLSDPDMREAGLSGLLHDIGKARIPLEILNKPSSLSDDEFATVKRHPEHGFEALRHGGVSDSVREACLHHHERMDGAGYPHRQAGKAISLMARMTAVCDVYDAITSDRPYKRGWDPADALSKMISWKGHFDPTVLSAFIEVVGIYPTGSLVRLKSEKLAVVVEQNKQSYTRPTVRAFYCIASTRAIPAELIDLSGTEEDCVVGSEDRDRLPTAVIEKLWAGELYRER
ncbi:HD-GYP domain-containing protein [Massilia sp. TWP1-3-3]|uniref:HD-GYP domain-containing protein n=1 Tax=Massilia sp. TWP1-3-3 TaxID=2804573 RepID=UPI003CF8A6C8